jgi:hypothetical protein
MEIQIKDSKILSQQPSQVSPLSATATATITADQIIDGAVQQAVGGEAPSLPLPQLATNPNKYVKVVNIVPQMSILGGLVPA